MLWRNRRLAAISSEDDGKEILSVIKILIVEDNYMNMILVRDLLSAHGYIVSEAENGKKALELVAVDRPDIIIMDLHLPEMDGTTAMKSLKAEETTRKIPIIALTAAAMRGDEEKIIENGFDGYVPKPVNRQVLLDVLEEKLKEVKSL
ncbi:MAG: response regulator [Deltaproteobacteria bacterium]|nr:response regulator [Deltaproteobacteria bacterium]